MAARNFLVGLTAAGLLAFAAAGCTQKPAAAPVAPNVALISERPSDYAGRSVELQGVVVSTQAAGVFTIADRMGGPAVVVISDRPALINPPLKQGDWVRVIGNIRTFDAGLLTRRAPEFGAGGETVDPVFVREQRGRPSIVATDVARMAYPPRAAAR
jgi:hypothetical protein